MGRVFRNRGGGAAASLLVTCMLAAAAGPGCRPARMERPPNPVLEDSQAKLAAVEDALRDRPAPTHEDYLELGVARYLVWNIYWERSRYPAVSGADRRQADENRQHAERLQPRVIDAFERAMNDAPDAVTAARAKVWLARVYSEIPDLDKETLWLQRILQDHANLDAPSAFGPSGRPQFYCYHTLAGIYQAREQRASAIDALARAILAADAARKAGRGVGDAPMAELGRLIDYEPRIVLPRYQRLLPAGIDDSGQSPGPQTAPAPALAELFRTHCEEAPTRIAIAVEHQDPVGLLVRWQVNFPAYQGIIEAWEKDLKNPRPRLADDFSRRKPAFRLRFATLPTTESFDLPKQPTVAFGPTPWTPVLAFDENGRSEGRMILPWSQEQPLVRHQSLYLVAQIVADVNGGRAGAPAAPAQNVYMEPIEIRQE